MHFDDPWRDHQDPGWAEDRTAAPSHGPRPAAEDARPQEEKPEGRAAGYLAVHGSAAFQRLRRGHRRFVLSAAAAFLLWYSAYLGAAVCAPGLMARPVAGVLNVAMAAGLAQFAVVFLLTWVHARRSRLHRDGPALELRWRTQEAVRAAESIR